jgi:hypothetical protein
MMTNILVTMTIIRPIVLLWMPYQDRLAIRALLLSISIRSQTFMVQSELIAMFAFPLVSLCRLSLKELVSKDDNVKGNVIIYFDILKFSNCIYLIAEGQTLLVIHWLTKLKSNPQSFCVVCLQIQKTKLSLCIQLEYWLKCCKVQQHKYVSKNVIRRSAIFRNYVIVSIAHLQNAGGAEEILRIRIETITAGEGFKSSSPNKFFHTKQIKFTG